MKQHLVFHIPYFIREVWVWIFFVLLALYLFVEQTPLLGLWLGSYMFNTYHYAMYGMAFAVWFFLFACFIGLCHTFPSIKNASLWLIPITLLSLTFTGPWVLLYPQRWIALGVGGITFVAIVIILCVGHRFWPTKQFSLPASLTLTLACLLFLGLYGMNDRVSQGRLRMELLLAQGKYKKAAMLSLPFDNTNASLTMLRMYALSRCGLAEEHLFEYPLSDGASSLLPHKGETNTYVYPSQSVNKWAHAHREEYTLMSALMERRLDTFAELLVLSHKYNHNNLPKHFKEALLLYNHLRSKPIYSYKNEVMEADFQEFRKTTSLRPASYYQAMRRHTHMAILTGIITIILSAEPLVLM